jgi:hypothetical protein
LEKKLLCFLHLDELALKFQVIIEQLMEIMHIIICVPNQHAKKDGDFLPEREFNLGVMQFPLIDGT